MNRVLQIAGCVVTAFCCACAQQQRQGGFRVIGPGGGGAMFHPAISPHDPLTALLACDMTGAYITHDGGHTWRMFNLREPVRFFVFDPLQANVLYAETSVLWRSTDSGLTWHMVQPAPSKNLRIEMPSDHAEETVLSPGDTLGTISAMAADPAHPHTLLASAGRDHSAERYGLFRSPDGGAHWSRIGSLPEPAEKLWVTPAGDVLVMTPNFVVRTGRGAATTRLPGAGAVTDASAGVGARSVLYAIRNLKLLVSHDEGETWSPSTLPGNGAKVRAVAASLHHSDTVYASYSQLEIDGTQWHGVARSTDAGRSWQLVWKESAEPAPNVQDAWITRDLGTGWGENPLNLGVSDNDPSLVYGTDYGRTLISRDGGAHWTAAYSTRTPDGAWTSTGLDVTTAYGIHFDPFDPRDEFITYTDVGLFRSRTAGASWERAMSGVPREWDNTAYWMIFDPAVKGRAWMVNSGTHDLPRPKMWRNTSTATYRGGVCLTEDDGQTWQTSSTGMLQTAATDIVLDPASPVNARVLYVSAFGRGVYKSTDGGRTWSLKNVGLVQQFPLAWRLTLAANGTLYLVVARRSEHGSIGDSGDGALYRSTDHAQTWQPMALPAGVNGPNGIAVDPAKPERLYLAAWARDAGEHGEGGGVYRSDDGGAHWTASLTRDQHVYDVTLDPRMPGTVYAAGFESSAWVSRDSGAKWSRIGGYNFKWGHRVLLDPADPNSVYISTFGGGVWHGRVQTSQSPLDIATPEMEPHL